MCKRAKFIIIILFFQISGEFNREISPLGDWEGLFLCLLSLSLSLSLSLLLLSLSLSVSLSQTSLPSPLPPSLLLPFLLHGLTLLVYEALRY